MFRSWLRSIARATSTKATPRKPRRVIPNLEQLGERIAPAVTASFKSGGGVLIIKGDNADNTILVSRNGAGLVTVNGKRVNSPAGFVKAVKVKVINVNALGGNDTVTLSPLLGGLPKASVLGGAGNDVVRINGGDAADGFTVSGSGALTLVGGAADLTIGATESLELNTLGGADVVIVNNLAGTGVTTLRINLGAGDSAADTVTVNGTAAADAIAAVAPAAGVAVNGLAAQILLAQTESADDRLTINGLGGDDVLSGGILASLIRLTLDGGAGNDTINGSNGADTLLGGDGNDTIDGNQGNDTAQMGAGNDTFVWDPGDGSDVVEGQAGDDTLRFNGNAGAEQFAASANGARLQFTRFQGNIVMDVDDVEILNLNAFGGADSITINDLDATDVTTVNLDLGVGGAGDGAADTVVINATAAADVVQVVLAAVLQVNGLQPLVNIVQPEVANDRVVVNGLGGNDTLSGGGLLALIQLTLDGGDGNDTINGSNGADTLNGGAGDDTIDGNQGNDTAFLGAGDDAFFWDPGDGSDIVEGQDGLDTLRFNGNAGAEQFTAQSQNGRLEFLRVQGTIDMDTDDVEILTLNAFGGADTITVNDLAATDIALFNLALGVLGAGDVANDSVTINGSAGVDVMSLSGTRGAVTLVGPAVTLQITNAEPANDTLTINTLGEADIVSASGLANDSIDLTINGGADADILVGSQGGDTINGEDGNDLIQGGAGNDALDGGAGTDTIDGGAGTDSATNGETVTGVP